MLSVSGCVGKCSSLRSLVLSSLRTSPVLSPLNLSRCSAGYLPALLGLVRCGPSFFPNIPSRCRCCLCFVPSVLGWGRRVLGRRNSRRVI